jgi:hypothetical protein
MLNVGFFVIWNLLPDLPSNDLPRNYNTLGIGYCGGAP